MVLFLIHCQTRVLSSVFEIFRSRKRSLNREFKGLTEDSILRNCFRPGDVQTRPCRQRANFTRVSKALVDTQFFISVVYHTEEVSTSALLTIWATERRHPCGVPTVFTISSSDLVPLRLTLCGRSHRNCLIQRTRVCPKAFQ